MTHDMVKGSLAKLGYVSKHARLLADTWKKMIDEMGGVDGGGVIIHYAHSIGGTNTIIARDLLTPEEQKMIRVITLGSATMVPNVGFQSAVNYVSSGDGLSRIFYGLYNLDSTVIFLDSHFEVPLLDHMITMETYSRAMQMLGKQFLETYGPKN